ncbi:TRAP transporter small permease [Phaeobacter sp. HF9A]|uniref:TRAP transporter small permease n=1 Tax=Phaeobacter sp. HF9A TaxID=2721561 RepID=UPI0014319699|nr:TRAP transporter small permease subunit [Phaeobacter sp. HF9A]NIZ15051.1 TRAP transporter small permease subunit [Phaeobacter sp. HF9A]
MIRACALLRRAAELIVGTLIALMFLTFVLQITIRYSARLGWISEALPFLDPSRYGWTLEFCLLLWVWIIFIGCAFVVRDEDHVSFDMLYSHVGPRLRRGFVIFGALVIAAGLALSVEPTWSKFYILRLKKTATLSNVFGDWIRMRDIYSVYMLFLITVTLRYAWTAYQAIRHGILPTHNVTEGDK